MIEGEIEAGKRYEEADFNKIIEIKEREKKRVEIFMSQIDQREKTLVFCANQAHALAVRDLINQMKTSTDPNYCQRVTANDGALGEQHLRDFQDNEKTIPTILTTSQKLSTGVDARNIRNIVLMRPINSMIEFKQIIGRGTRLYDGKDYFTIYDFVKAHHHFSDPEWDGEPLEPEACAKCGCTPLRLRKAPPQPCQVCGERPCECENEPCPKCGQRPCVCKKKAKVKLADGKERTIQHMMATSFWHPDGTPMSAQQFMEALFGKLPEFFKDEEELRALWSAPDTRRKLLEGLAEKGFGKDQLAEMQKIEQAFKNIDDVLWKEAGCTSELDYTEQTSWLLFLKYLDALEQDKAMEAELEGKKYTFILDEPYRWESWAAPKDTDGKLDHNKAMTGDDLRDFVNRKLFPYLHGFKQKASGPNTIEYKIGEIFGEIKNKIHSGYNLREIIDHIDELRFRSQTEKHELSHLYEAKIKNMGNAGRNGGEYYTPRPLIRAMVQGGEAEDRRAHLRRRSAVGGLLVRSLRLPRQAQAGPDHQRPEDPAEAHLLRQGEEVAWPMSSPS